MLLFSYLFLENNLREGQERGIVSKILHGFTQLDYPHGENMSKMFGITILNSPFAPLRRCLSRNAQKMFCKNFGRYDLANDKYSMVNFWILTSDKLPVQDPMVESLKSSKGVGLHPWECIEVKNRNFDVSTPKNTRKFKGLVDNFEVF